MGKESIDRFISQFNAISAASSLLKITTDNRQTEYNTHVVDQLKAQAVNTLPDLDIS